MCKKLEVKLAYHSAPALCGLKASNLISIKKNDIENLEEEIKTLNITYNPKICFDLLKDKDDNYLILVYRKDSLEEHLMQEENQKFLESIGYTISNNIFDYIRELKRRINSSNEFPHEIGIFLGYDLLDTVEFIKGNRNPLLKGLWNVYYDAYNKQIIFDKFNRCKDCVVRLVNKGFSIENFMK